MHDGHEGSIPRICKLLGRGLTALRSSTGPQGRRETPGGSPVACGQGPPRLWSSGARGTPETLVRKSKGDAARKASGRALQLACWRKPPRCVSVAPGPRFHPHEVGDVLSVTWWRFCSVQVAVFDEPTVFLFCLSNLWKVSATSDGSVDLIFSPIFKVGACYL